jgi:hypothetical protein
MLLVLLSPRSSSEQFGTGARPVHPILGLTFRLPAPTKIDATDGFLPKALRHSHLPNLIVRNLVGFMYFEEAVPAAKCDTLANTYL